MNEIVNKFLLAGSKVMPEIHLRHVVLVDHLQKTKKEYKHFKETGDSQYIY